MTVKRIPDSELVGVTLTRDHVAGFADPRDSMSKDRRVAGRDEMQQLRDSHDEVLVPYGEEAYLFGGRKGTAKTTSAAWWAAHYFVRGGYVFSIHGLGFGQEITLQQLVRFADIIPPQSLILIDEAHLVSSTYGSGSLRNELLLNSLTLVRHKGCVVIFVTVAETSLDWRMRAEVKTAIYPKYYSPRSGRYTAPPKCYVWPWLIGDYPWEDRTPRLSTIHGIDPPASALSVERMQTPIPPHQMYRTWCVMDTWSEPSVTEGATMTAGKIHKSLEREEELDAQKQASPDVFFAALVDAYEDGWEMGETMIGWELVDRVARENGWTHEDPRAALGYLKSWLPVNGQNRVKPRDLAAFLVKIAIGAGP